MAKSAEAFRTISEVAEWLDLPTHVLRFWESKFTQVKPVKRAGGRRYYRPNDMVLLGGIKKLLHDDGMTIKGAQKMLRDHGVKHIASLSQPLDGDLIEAEVEYEAAAPEPALETPRAPEVGIQAETVPDTDHPEDTTAPAQMPAFSHHQDEDDSSDEPTEPATEAARVQDHDDHSESAAEPAPKDIEDAGLNTEPAALPSFLQPSKDADTERDATEAAPVSLAISLPDDPSDTELDVSAGLLSRIAAYKSAPTDEVRRILVQARHDLKALSS